MRPPAVGYFATDGGVHANPLMQSMQAENAMPQISDAITHTSAPVFTATAESTAPAVQKLQVPETQELQVPEINTVDRESNAQEESTEKSDTEVVVTYDDSDKVKSRATYKNGVLHGEECQYENGLLTQRAWYKNGMIGGLLETYAQQRIQSFMQYKDGQNKWHFCILFLRMVIIRFVHHLRMDCCMVLQLPTTKMAQSVKSKTIEMAILMAYRYCTILLAHRLSMEFIAKDKNMAILHSTHQITKFKRSLNTSMELL